MHSRTAPIAAAGVSPPSVAGTTVVWAWAQVEATPPTQFQTKGENQEVLKFSLRTSWLSSSYIFHRICLAVHVHVRSPPPPRALSFCPNIYVHTPEPGSSEDPCVSSFETCTCLNADQVTSCTCLCQVGLTISLV